MEVGEKKQLMGEGVTLCFHVLHIPLKLVQALKSENADIRQRTQNLQKMKYNIKHNYFNITIIIIVLVVVVIYILELLECF